MHNFASPEAIEQVLADVSKILLVGGGPLPEPDLPMPDGTILRSWQLARALQAGGHAVDFVGLPGESHPAAAENSSILVSTRRVEGISCSLVHTHQFHRALGALQEIQSRKRYDGLVAVGLNAAALVSRLPSTLPAWFDFGDGPPLAENQARCRSLSSDDGLKTTWARIRSSLRRGDRFSAATSRHTWALVGELGGLGRLNSLTQGYSFASTIPPAVPEWTLEPGASSPRFRGNLFPDTARAALWTGTFHPWFDYRTLASALSLAFEQEPALHFVCAGATPSGLENSSSAPFAAVLQRAGFGERCHFLGPVTAREALALMRECDAGIVTDAPGYASALGFHTRLLAWMGAGLPVLTTSGSEIADILEERDLARVVKMGKIQEIADLLVRMVRHPSDSRGIAQRAQRFVREHFTSPTLAAPLLRWAGEPVAAPDTLEKIRREPRIALSSEIAINPLEQEAVHAEQNLAEELARTRKELDQLKRKLLVRVSRKIFR